MERIKEKILTVGLKATDEVLLKKAIQSLYDMRAILAKIIHTLNSPH